VSDDEVDDNLVTCKNHSASKPNQTLKARPAAFTTRIKPGKGATDSNVSKGNLQQPEKPTVEKTSTAATAASTSNTSKTPAKQSNTNTSSVRPVTQQLLKKSCTTFNFPGRGRRQCTTCSRSGTELYYPVACRTCPVCRSEKESPNVRAAASAAAAPVAVAADADVMADVLADAANMEANVDADDKATKSASKGTVGASALPRKRKSGAQEQDDIVVRCSLSASLPPPPAPIHTYREYTRR
jgi:hypothetical protein